MTLVSSAAHCAQGPEGADIPLCVAMTVILCHCSCSRSSSITVLIKPVSEAMRNRASGSDWGSMEYLRYTSRNDKERKGEGRDSEESPERVTK